MQDDGGEAMDLRNFGEAMDLRNFGEAMDLRKLRGKDAKVGSAVLSSHEKICLIYHDLSSNSFCGNF